MGIVFKVCDLTYSMYLCLLYSVHFVYLVYLCLLYLVHWVYVVHVTYLVFLLFRVCSKYLNIFSMCALLYVVYLCLPYLLHLVYLPSLAFGVFGFEDWEKTLQEFFNLQSSNPQNKKKYLQIFFFCP